MTLMMMIKLMIVIITIMRRHTSVCFDNSPQCVKAEISIAENRLLQYCKPQKQALYAVSIMEPVM